MDLMQRILMVMAAVVFGASVHAVEKPQRAVLVELFSSQGCDSCPPAEARLRDAMNGPGALKNAVVLSWHVDVWDYLGWRDTWASRKNTERQQQYVRAKKVSGIVTPQFFVNGLALNDSRSLAASVKEAQNDADIRIDLKLTVNGSDLRAEYFLKRIDNEIVWPETLHAFPVLYQREGKVTPTAGENRGTELTGVNMVRAVGESVAAERATLRKISVVFAIPEGVEAGNLGVAVLVEDSKTMRPYASQTAIVKP